MKRTFISTPPSDEHLENSRLAAIKRVEEYQPKTGARCSCKRGVQRDNCPNCEGTGWVIDFRKIREQNKPTEKKEKP